MSDDVAWIPQELLFYHAPDDITRPLLAKIHRHTSPPSTATADASNLLQESLVGIVELTEDVIKPIAEQWWDEFTSGRRLVSIPASNTHFTRMCLEERWLASLPDTQGKKIDLSDSPQTKQVSNTSAVMRMTVLSLFGLIELQSDSPLFPRVCKRTLETISHVISTLAPFELRHEAAESLDCFQDFVSNLVQLEPRLDPAIVSTAANVLVALSVSRACPKSLFRTIEALLMLHDSGRTDVKVTIGPSREALLAFDADVPNCVFVPGQALDQWAFRGHSTAGTLAFLTATPPAPSQGTFPCGLTSDATSLFVHDARGVVRVSNGASAVCGHVMARNAELGVDATRSWLVRIGPYLLLRTAEDAHCLGRVLSCETLKAVCVLPWPAAISSSPPPATSHLVCDGRRLYLIATTEAQTTYARCGTTLTVMVFDVDGLSSARAELDKCEVPLLEQFELVAPDFDPVLFPKKDPGPLTDSLLQTCSFHCSPTQMVLLIPPPVTKLLMTKLVGVSRVFDLRTKAFMKDIVHSKEVLGTVACHLDPSTCRLWSCREGCFVESWYCPRLARITRPSQNCLSGSLLSSPLGAVEEVESADPLAPFQAALELSSCVERLLDAHHSFLVDTSVSTNALSPASFGLSSDTYVIDLICSFLERVPSSSSTLAELQFKLVWVHIAHANVLHLGRAISSGSTLSEQLEAAISRLRKVLLLLSLNDYSIEAPAPAVVTSSDAATTLLASLTYLPVKPDDAAQFYMQVMETPSGSATVCEAIARHPPPYSTLSVPLPFRGLHKPMSILDVLLARSVEETRLRSSFPALPSLTPVQRALLSCQNAVLADLFKPVVVKGVTAAAKKEAAAALAAAAAVPRPTAEVRRLFQYASLVLDACAQEIDACCDTGQFRRRGSSVSSTSLLACVDADEEIGCDRSCPLATRLRCSTTHVLVPMLAMGLLQAVSDSCDSSGDSSLLLAQLESVKPLVAALDRLRRVFLCLQCPDSGSASANANDRSLSPAVSSDDSNSAARVRSASVGKAKEKPVAVSSNDDKPRHEVCSFCPSFGLSWVVDLQGVLIRFAARAMNEATQRADVTVKSGPLKTWLASDLLSGHITSAAPQQPNTCPLPAHPFLADLVGARGVAAALLSYVQSAGQAPQMLTSMAGAATLLEAERYVFAAMLKHSHLVDTAQACAGTLEAEGALADNHATKLRGVFAKAREVTLWGVQQGQVEKSWRALVRDAAVLSSEAVSKFAKDHIDQMRIENELRFRDLCSIQCIPLDGNAGAASEALCAKLEEAASAARQRQCAPDDDDVDCYEIVATKTRKLASLLLQISATGEDLEVAAPKAELPNPFSSSQPRRNLPDSLFEQERTLSAASSPMKGDDDPPSLSRSISCLAPATDAFLAKQQRSSLVQQTANSLGRRVNDLKKWLDAFANWKRWQASKVASYNDSESATHTTVAGLVAAFVRSSADPQEVRDALTNRSRRDEVWGRVLALLSSFLNFLSGGDTTLAFFVSLLNSGRTFMAVGRTLAPALSSTYTSLLETLASVVHKSREGGSSKVVCGSSPAAWLLLLDACALCSSTDHLVVIHRLHLVGLLQQLFEWAWKEMGQATPHRNAEVLMTSSWNVQRLLAVHTINRFSEVSNANVSSSSHVLRGLVDDCVAWIAARLDCLPPASAFLRAKLQKQQADALILLHRLVAFPSGLECVAEPKFVASLMASLNLSEPTSPRIIKLAARLLQRILPHTDPLLCLPKLSVWLATIGKLQVASRDHELPPATSDRTPPAKDVGPDVVAETSSEWVLYGHPSGLTEREWGQALSSKLSSSKIQRSAVMAIESSVRVELTQGSRSTCESVSGALANIGAIVTVMPVMKVSTQSRNKAIRRARLHSDVSDVRHILTTEVASSLVVEYVSLFHNLLAHGSEAWQMAVREAILTSLACSDECYEAVGIFAMAQADSASDDVAGMLPDAQLASQPVIGALSVLTNPCVGSLSVGSRVRIVLPGSELISQVDLQEPGIATGWVVQTMPRSASALVLRECDLKRPHDDKAKCLLRVPIAELAIIPSSELPGEAIAPDDDVRLLESLCSVMTYSVSEDIEQCDLAWLPAFLKSSATYAFATIISALPGPLCASHWSRLSTSSVGRDAHEVVTALAQEPTPAIALDAACRDIKMAASCLWTAATAVPHGITVPQPESAPTCFDPKFAHGLVFSSLQFLGFHRRGLNRNAGGGGLRASADKARLTAVAANRAIPAGAARYYFEVTIDRVGGDDGSIDGSSSSDGLIGVGLVTVDAKQKGTLGSNCFGYFSNGQRMWNFNGRSPQTEAYGTSFGAGSTIGCLWTAAGDVVFTCDGVLLPKAFNSPPALFPAVITKGLGAMVRANFGAAPFVYSLPELEVPAASAGDLAVGSPERSVDALAEEQVPISRSPSQDLPAVPPEFAGFSEEQFHQAMASGIDMLTSMGFSPRHAMRGMIATNFQLEAASDWCIMNPPEPDPVPPQSSEPVAPENSEGSPHLSREASDVSTAQSFKGESEYSIHESSSYVHTNCFVMDPVEAVDNDDSSSGNVPEHPLIQLLTTAVESSRSNLSPLERAEFVAQVRAQLDTDYNLAVAMVGEIIGRQVPLSLRRPPDPASLEVNSSKAVKAEDIKQDEFVKINLPSKCEDTYLQASDGRVAVVIAVDSALQLVLAESYCEEGGYSEQLWYPSSFVRSRLPPPHLHTTRSLDPIRRSIVSSSTSFARLSARRCLLALANSSSSLTAVPSDESDSSQTLQILQFCAQELLMPSPQRCWSKLWDALWTQLCASHSQASLLSAVITRTCSLVRSATALCAKHTYVAKEQATAATPVSSAILLEIPSACGLIISFQLPTDKSGAKGPAPAPASNGSSGSGASDPPVCCVYADSDCTRVLASYVALNEAVPLFVSQSSVWLRLFPSKSPVSLRVTVCPALPDLHVGISLCRELIQRSSSILTCPTDFFSTVPPNPESTYERAPLADLTSCLLDFVYQSRASPIVRLPAIQMLSSVYALPHATLPTAIVHQFSSLRSEVSQLVPTKPGVLHSQYAQALVDLLTSTCQRYGWAALGPEPTGRNLATDSAQFSEGTPTKPVATPDHGQGDSVDGNCGGQLKSTTLASTSSTLEAGNGDCSVNTVAVSAVSASNTSACVDVASPDSSLAMPSASGGDDDTRSPSTVLGDDGDKDEVAVAASAAASAALEAATHGVAVPAAASDTLVSGNDASATSSGSGANGGVGARGILTRNLFEVLRGTPSEESPKELLVNNDSASSSEDPKLQSGQASQGSLCFSISPPRRRPVDAAFGSGSSVPPFGLAPKTSTASGDKEKTGGKFRRTQGRFPTKKKAVTLSEEPKWFTEVVSAKQFLRSFLEPRAPLARLVVDKAAKLVMLSNARSRTLYVRNLPKLPLSRVEELVGIVQQLFGQDIVGRQAVYVPMNEQGTHTLGHVFVETRTQRGLETALQTLSSKIVADDASTAESAEAGTTHQNEGSNKPATAVPLKLARLQLSGTHDAVTDFLRSKLLKGTTEVSPELLPPLQEIFSWYSRPPISTSSTPPFLQLHDLASLLLCAWFDPDRPVPISAFTVEGSSVSGVDASDSSAQSSWKTRPGTSMASGSSGSGSSSGRDRKRSASNTPSIQSSAVDASSPGISATLPAGDSDVPLQDAAGQATATPISSTNAARRSDPASPCHPTEPSASSSLASPTAAKQPVVESEALVRARKAIVQHGEAIASDSVDSEVPSKDATTASHHVNDGLSFAGFLRWFVQVCMESPALAFALLENLGYTYELGAWRIHCVAHRTSTVVRASRMGAEHTARFDWKDGMYEALLGWVISVAAKKYHGISLDAVTPDLLLLPSEEPSDGTKVSLPALLEHVGGPELRLRWAVILTANKYMSSLLPFVDWSCSKMPHTLAYNLVQSQFLLFTTVKMELFSSALVATSTKTKEPSINVNRLALRDALDKGASLDLHTSVFGQAFLQLHPTPAQWLRQPKPSGAETHCSFTVVFRGEHVQGAGGPYRQFFTDVSNELQSAGLLKLFVPCPNAVVGVGNNREMMLPSPSASSPEQLNAFEFLGRLMGVALRTSVMLSLDLPPLFWKLLNGNAVEPSDFLCLDDSFSNTLEYLRSVDTEGFQSVWADHRFTIMCSDHSIRELVPGGEHVPLTLENREEYINLASRTRLYESEAQIMAIRNGLLQVVPSCALALFSWHDLRQGVCGVPDIDVQLLRKHTIYGRGVNESDTHIGFFWEVLTSFSQAERRRFIRFAWGQERIPLDDAAFARTRTRFMIKAYEKNNPDAALPMSDTCFFNLTLPRYSTADRLRNQLLLAINADSDSMNADVPES